MVLTKCSTKLCQASAIERHRRQILSVSSDTKEKGRASGPSKTGLPPLKTGRSSTATIPHGGKFLERSLLSESIRMVIVSRCLTRPSLTRRLCELDSSFPFERSVLRGPHFVCDGAFERV